jgi:hypothetical protein
VSVTVAKPAESVYWGETEDAEYWGLISYNLQETGPVAFPMQNTGGDERTITAQRTGMYADAPATISFYICNGGTSKKYTIYIPVN